MIVYKEVRERGEGWYILKQPQIGFIEIIWMGHIVEVVWPAVKKKNFILSNLTQKIECILIYFNWWHLLRSIQGSDRCVIDLFQLSIINKIIDIFLQIVINFQIQAINHARQFFIREKTSSQFVKNFGE